MTTETETEAIYLADRIKALRQKRGMTLAQIEERCGVRASTVSKIERGAVSPSYSTLLKLAKGLGVDLTELFEPPKQNIPKTRRIITRAGEGPMYSIGTHDYRFLCSELKHKKMNPMVATVRAHEIAELVNNAHARQLGDRRNGLASHEGEEVMFVISGTVVLHTEFYSPIELGPGDCAYIDSTMGHACLRAGPEDAQIFWVCTELAITPKE